jgi:predicted Zn-dependent protease
MKTLTLILFSLLIVLGCKSRIENERHVPKKQAVELNKEAMKIAMNEESYNQKVDSAIFLLQKAINIDSLYIEARLNIIRFTYMKNDIEVAIKNCHDLQKIHPTSPMFLILEGGILESQNQVKEAEKLYKTALDLYENELYKELDKNPNLELEYIECLVLNNQKKKASSRLIELKKNNTENPFYNNLTINILMEGHSKLIKTNHKSHFAK